MRYSKDFDQYLKVTKGTAEYYADKSKAGTIGGSVGRNTPAHNNTLARAWSLYKLKGEKEIMVLCLKDTGPYKRGKKYRMTVAPGFKIVSPYKMEFPRWYDFAVCFKRLKTIQ